MRYPQHRGYTTLATPRASPVSGILETSPCAEWRGTPGLGVTGLALELCSITSSCVTLEKRVPFPVCKAGVTTSTADGLERLTGAHGWHLPNHQLEVLTPSARFLAWRLHLAGMGRPFHAQETPSVSRKSCQKPRLIIISVPGVEASGDLACPVI